MESASIYLHTNQLTHRYLVWSDNRRKLNDILNYSVALVHMARGQYQVASIVPVQGCRVLTFQRSRLSPSYTIRVHLRCIVTNPAINGISRDIGVKAFYSCGDAYIETGHHEATASDGLPNIQLFI